MNRQPQPDSDSELAPEIGKVLSPQAMVKRF